MGDTWLARHIAIGATSVVVLAQCLLATSWLACTQSSMEQPPLLPLPDGGQSRFADTLISFTQGGQSHRCYGGTVDAACAQVQVLGPPDGNRFTLGPRDVIEVALLNGFILEHPTTEPFQITPDFKIWATVPPGQQSTGGGPCRSAVVEVSDDGSRYHVLDCLGKDNPDMDLARVGLTQARFVRIVDLGTGGIAVDGVEAL